MTAIELFHLRRARDKPRAVALLTEQAGLTAQAALAVVHQAVGGGKPQVSVAGDEAAARRLIVALADTGFVARRAAVDHFDAARHAGLALDAVLPRCAPGAANAAGAALLAGDWAEALALTLQHLQVHRPAADADRLRLERAAIDTGLVRGVPGRV
ncbi:hypothetical protein [Ottowia testudinis]|uniref:Uncharacterized protein n=1 Tax=Ottowia testudinis TaxID=2816950 RepID=A0A975CKM9_9BURK|nr:hypothetical protein [Ottowia testudinis]QTD46747.1 hypothetical protein J1M35_07715 [Ottowia testudinis]